MRGHEPSRAPCAVRVRPGRAPPPAPPACPSQPPPPSSPEISPSDGEAHDTSVGGHRRAVHAGAADDAHAPAALGAGAQHGEGVVAQQQVVGREPSGRRARRRRRSSTGRSAPQTHSAAVRATGRRRASMPASPHARRDRRRGARRSTRPARSGRERRAAAASGTEQRAVGAQQRDVDLGVAAVDGEDVGAAWSPTRAPAPRRSRSTRPSRASSSSTARTSLRRAQAGDDQRQGGERHVGPAVQEHDGRRRRDLTAARDDRLDDLVGRAAGSPVLGVDVPADVAVAERRRGRRARARRPRRRRTGSGTRASSARARRAAGSRLRRGSRCARMPSSVIIVSGTWW